MNAEEVYTSLNKKIKKGGITDDKIKQIVEQHFEENPVQVITDNTLSVAGIPADALATGTAVDSLKEELDEYKLSDVTANDCDFIKIGTNLFNKKTVTKGYYVDPGTGNLLVNPKFWTSDFIEVESNTTYTIRYKNQSSQFDKDKKCLGLFTGEYSDTTNAKSITATTTPTTKYVRICGSLDQLDSDQFEKGDSFTSYEEFSQKIESSLLPETKTLEDIVYKIFSGTNTKIKLVGDSITHGQGGTGFAQNGEYIASVFGNKYYRNPNGYCWAKII